MRRRYMKKFDITVAWIATALAVIVGIKVTHSAW